MSLQTVRSDRFDYGLCRIVPRVARPVAWAISLLAFLSAPAAAHMMSMSSGDVLVSGPRLRYELRMPLYEVGHIEKPEDSLFKHIAFSQGGEQGRLVSKSCSPEHGSYRCSAEYAFTSPVEVLEIRCRFHTITVPNHVHLLRAEKDGARDQAIFDFSFQEATLRFRPPTRFEIIVTELGAGFMRALGGWAQVLFLGALVLAARTKRELAWLALSFLAGQSLSALLLPHMGMQFAPRFVEAASALSIAYLAVEVLFLPGAGWRWLVAGVLGVFHGLYFELFIRESGYHAAWVLAGASGADLIVLAVFAFGFARLRRVHQLRPVQISASLLLVTGLTWFFWRLAG